MRARGVLLRRVRRVLSTACAVVCAYAAWRLVMRPEECGPVEAVAVAGGWGLSLLPVHAVAYGGRGRVCGAFAAYRRRGRNREGGNVP